MSTEDQSSAILTANIKQEASDWVAKHDCGLVRGRAGRVFRMAC